MRAALLPVLAILAACAPRAVGKGAARVESVAAGGGTFRIQYRAEDGGDAARVKSILPRAAARVARWGRLAVPVTILIHPSHGALEEAIHRVGYGWLRAWARYATVDLQAPRTWAFLGVGDADIEELLTHELTHCAMYQAAGDERSWRLRGIPPWFREGMASVTAGQERRSVDRDGLRADYARRAPTAGGEKGRDPARDPLNDAAPATEEESEVVYGASHWAFQFLLDRYGDERVRRILARMGQGQTFADAFRDGVGVTDEEFEREFRHYIAWRGWR
jgi:hypothetical protein